MQLSCGVRMWKLAGKSPWRQCARFCYRSNGSGSSLFCCRAPSETAGQSLAWSTETHSVGHSLAHAIKANSLKVHSRQFSLVEEKRGLRLACGNRFLIADWVDLKLTRAPNYLTCWRSFWEWKRSGYLSIIYHRIGRINFCFRIEPTNGEFK